jgi:hypothetical protein
MPNPFSLVTDLLTNNTRALIMGVEKCTYQSTFISPIDKNKYGIVSDSIIGLDSVSCICQNEDKSSTNEKAIKLSNFSKNPIPGLSSNKYVCVISPNINIK